MKALIIATSLLVTSIAHSAQAQVGETRSSIEAVLGNPSNESGFGRVTVCDYTDGRWNYRFSYSGGNCVGVSYKKVDKSRLALEEVKQLLQRNGNGLEWILQPTGDPDLIVYVRRDSCYKALLGEGNFLAIAASY